MTRFIQYAPELVTDFYEFTMAASYLREEMSGQATFSLFIRGYPMHRAYYVSAGLEPLLDLIRGLRFSEESIAYLDSTGRFQKEFLDYLRSFRFSGTVRAIREGRIFFAQEPVIEVTAPIIDAQILETLIINSLHHDIMVASKAARCLHAARGRTLIDFSLRRNQGIDAGVKTARDSYIAGFSGTSNVLAGKLHDIPVYGTMAHSYITSFDSEMEAFEAFARAFPDSTVLLVDTYDTIRGTEKALQVARRMREQGREMIGIRLDSGDMGTLSRQVRQMCRDAGFGNLSIMFSGNMNEYRLQDLLDEGAEVDVVAIGTRLGVSADAPYLDMSYKLVEYDGRPVLKLSSGKKTLVKEKQVYRLYDDRGRMSEDILGLREEDRTDGERLLEVVLENGERVYPHESLDDIRQRFSREWDRLPAPYKEIRPLQTYPVTISPSLLRSEEETVRRLHRDELENH